MTAMLLIRRSATSRAVNRAPKRTRTAPPGGSREESRAIAATCQFRMRRRRRCWTAWVYRRLPGSGRRQLNSAACSMAARPKPPTDGRARVTKLLTDLNETLAEEGRSPSGGKISENFQVLFGHCFRANTSITKATPATVLIAMFYGAMDSTKKCAAKEPDGAKGSPGDFGKYTKIDAATCLIFIEDFMEWAERTKDGLRDAASDELWLILGVGEDDDGFGAEFMVSLERLMNEHGYSFGSDAEPQGKIRMICRIWQSSGDFAQWSRGKFLLVAALREHLALAGAEIQQENEDFVTGMFQAGKVVAEGGAFDASLRDILEELVQLDPDDLPGLQLRQERGDFDQGGRQFMEMTMRPFRCGTSRCCASWT